jgi:non-specific serine/threonine protein kinase
MEFTPPFGTWLKAQRSKLDLTQGDLARRLGYSPETIRKIEAGVLKPSKQIVDLLADHLGVPSWQRDAFLMFATEARVKSALPALGNLPVQLTHFIGRANDIVEVKQLLGATRLLTLTGSGGVGKTRLAQEAASRMANAFKDGVWLVELAPLANPELIADAIAVAFGLRPTSQPARVLLIEHLRDRNALLILDNCEHLIGECAELAEAMLRACLRLRILATSREPLKVPGETMWRVPSLATSDAVHLFAARARAAKPDFQLTDHNRDAVVQICERLDNIPLAIELAASRLRALSVEQIAGKLDDRFHLLTGGSRTALPRHQTLRALIDWSYGLMSSDEQRLLRWLSVFACGWTLEMAEAMHGSPDAVDLLAQLVNKSLVVLDENASEPRYTMLETIRQYGQDKLVEMDEEKQARQRHLEIMLALVEETKQHRNSPMQKYWFDRLDCEMGNLRAALSWVTESRDSEAAERLIDELEPFWFQRGYQAEGIEWIEATLLSTHSNSAAMRANGLNRICTLAYAKGDNVRAETAAREALQMAYQLKDEQLIFRAEVFVGYLSTDYDEAIHLLTRGIEFASHDGRDDDRRGAMFGLAHQAHLHGDFDWAKSLFNDALALTQKLNDDAFASGVKHGLGKIARAQGDKKGARALFEEAVAAGRKAGWSTVVANALIDLAALDVNDGNFADALHKLGECFPEYYRVGNVERIGYCLSVASGIAQAQGELNRAARLLGKTAAIRRDHSRHGVLGPELYAEYERRLPLVRAAMAPAEFERALAEGQAMSLQQAMDAAMAL